MADLGGLIDVMKRFLIILMLFSVLSCGPDKGIYAALDSVGIPASVAQFRYQVKTPGGVQVQSTIVVPAAALAAIDAAIGLQIERISAARPAWTSYRRLDQYSVLLVDPMAYSEIDLPGAPLLRLHGGGLTAGTVIGILGSRKTVDRSYIVVPHHAGQDWRFMDFFFQAIRNESEHARECNEPNRLNPSPECEQFATWNDTHPHFP